MPAASQSISRVARGGGRGGGDMNARQYTKAELTDKVLVLTAKKMSSCA